MHTYTCLGVPFTIALTRFTLGFQGQEEPWVLDRWEYAEPFAPDEVAAFSLGYWYIPLQEGRALPGYWLTERKPSKAVPAVQHNIDPLAG